MVRYETTAVIFASDEQVWNVLADVARWHEWTPTITRVEPLDSEPFNTGSRFRVAQPRLRPAVWTVTESTPPKGFTWESRSAGMYMAAEHSIRPRSEHECQVMLRMTFSGLLGNVIGRLYKNLTESYLAQEVATLKQRIETTVCDHQQCDFYR